MPKIKFKDKIEFGKWLSNSLIRKGLRQADISRELYVSRNIVSIWCNGESMATDEHLEKLFDYLDSVKDIATETPLQGQIVHDHAAMPLDQDPAYWRGKYEAQKEIVDQLLSAKKDKPDTPPASKPTTPDPKPPSAPPSGTVKKNQEKGSNKE